MVIQTTRVWVYGVDVARGICMYKARNSHLEVELPLDPMRGTVGLAPAAKEVDHELLPGAHGGNVDTPEIRSGATVYFGMNFRRGLVAMGDGDPKRSQGIPGYTFGYTSRSKRPSPIGGRASDLLRRW